MLICFDLPTLRIGLPFFIDRYQGPIHGVLAFNVSTAFLSSTDILVFSTILVLPITWLLFLEI